MDPVSLEVTAFRQLPACTRIFSRTLSVQSPLLDPVHQAHQARGVLDCPKKESQEFRAVGAVSHHFEGDLL